MRKNKRLIATLTAFSILLSTFLLVQPISLAAAKGTEVENNNLEVLFESNYDEVPDYASHRNDFFVGWGQALAGNAFPQNIDGNGYIAYTQNSNTLGVIRLGHDYKTNTIGEYNYVKAIPGRTYVIEYDMKVYANYFAINTNKLDQGWPQGGEGAYVGISVANPTADVKNKNVSQYIADTKEFVSYYEKVDTFELKSNPDSSTWEGNVDGWVHKSVEFTVPSELDVSVNNAIQLFMGNGSRCQISFDNIKVSLVSSKEDLIFKNNYDDVPDYASHRNDYYVGWGHSLAGNAFPQNIDGNGYIAYTQNSNSLGVIRLGHNYKTNTIGEYNYVKAIPGKTYVIEYDMKVYANYFAQSTPERLAQGWPQGGEDAYVGIAVANPTADIAGKDVRHYIADTKEFVSYYEKVDTFELKSNPDSSTWEGNVDGWVHKTVEFTVPADLDVSVNDAIQLFMGNGSRCQISFDNIKVSYKSDEVGDESVLADEDYSSANIAVDRPSKPFTNAYSDVLPVKDPSDDSNIVLEVRKNTAFCSFVYLGAQYKNKVEVTANTITVEPNTTYDISFDYKIVELDATKPDGTFNIGVCLTNANTTEGDPNKWYNNSFYKYEELFMTQDKVAVTDGWVNYKTSYTVTSKMDISEANKLAILCNVNTQRFAIYFDNVKVVKNDLVYTVKFDTAGGEEIAPIIGIKGDPYELPEKAVKEGCQFLGWYKDPEFLEEATNGTFDEALTIIYAKFKKVQFDQSFEDDYAAFPIGKSDWFEYIYWYNTPREYRGDKAWAQWTDPNLKYQYNADGVRSGDSSVYNPGTETAERLFTLMLREPLVVGEQYTISMWVKVEDYTLPGDFRLWFNNGTWNSKKLRTEVDWTSGGARQVTLINSKAMKEHLGEWIEVKADFVAGGKFAGIGTPGMTELYIDDVRITAKSVDESVSRTIAGKGLVFEDWYDSNKPDEDVYVPPVVTDEKVIIKYAVLEGLEEIADSNDSNDNTDKESDKESDNKPTSNNKVIKVKVKKPKTDNAPTDDSGVPVWPFVTAGVATVLVIAGVTTAVLVKKRKSGSK